MCDRPGVVLGDVARVARPLHITVKDMRRHITVVQLTGNGEGGRKTLRIEVPAVAALNVDAEIRIALDHCPARCSVLRFVGSAGNKTHPLASVVPHGIVHHHTYGLGLCLAVGLVGFCSRGGLHAPLAAVVGDAGQYALEVDAVDVLRYQSPDVDIRVQVVDGQVVEQRQMLQPADDHRIVAFLKDGFCDPVKHADTMLTG